MSPASAPFPVSAFGVSNSNDGCQGRARGGVGWIHQRKRTRVHRHKTLKAERGTALAKWGTSTHGISARGSSTERVAEAALDNVGVGHPQWLVLAALQRFQRRASPRAGSIGCGAFASDDAAPVVAAGTGRRGREPLRSLIRASARRRRTRTVYPPPPFRRTLLERSCNAQARCVTATGAWRVNATRPPERCRRRAHAAPG
jgi:hypothetical protein